MKTQFILGTSGWSYDDWRGIFYPEKLPKKDWLLFYQEAFDVVEINATFYRPFRDSVFSKWKEQAKNNFTYIVKAPRIITHKKYLLNCETLIQQFCQSVNVLGDKLALILLQLPPNLPYDLERLKTALRCFDNPGKLAVEFRDEKWYQPEVKKILEEVGCIFCAADSPKTDLQSWITSDTGYIRLHGKTKWFDYCYSQKELTAIAQFALKMAENGAKKMYILFNNTFHGNALDNAKSLGKLLGISLKS